jgi:hypothetical protein
MQLPCVFYRIKVYCDTAFPNGHTALSLFGPCRFRENKVVLETYKTTQHTASLPAEQISISPQSYTVFESCFHRYLAP